MQVFQGTETRLKCHFCAACRGNHIVRASSRSYLSLGTFLKPVHRIAAYRDGSRDGSRDGFQLGRTTFEQQAAAAGYLRSALGAQQQQQYQQQPQSIPGQQQFDSELLWAGYSDLSEQLRKVHAKQESLMEHIHELQGRIKHLQQQPSSASAWQAATFLLFFLGFINFVGLLANLHLGMFVPWAAKPTGTTLAKQLLGTVLPMTNTLVVLIFCLQAVKAAWVCLRW